MLRRRTVSSFVRGVAADAVTGRASTDVRGANGQSVDLGGPDAVSRRVTVLLAAVGCPQVADQISFPYQSPLDLSGQAKVSRRAQTVRGSCLSLHPAEV